MPTNRGEHPPYDPDAVPAGGPGPTPRRPPDPSPRRHPTGWIVLSCVLAAAVVGLGIWAFNAQSSADDAHAELASQAQAAAAATPAPTASTSTPAPAKVDPATQQEFDQIADELGATSESVDQIEQELDQASAKVEETKQAREDATGAVDAAKAEVDEFQARFELTRTCLRGTVDALGAALESGGMKAAVQELQKLAGDCASVASP